MSDLNIEEEKIPFDSEPIDRNKSSDYYRYVKLQKKQEASKMPKKYNLTSIGMIAMGLVVVLMGVWLFGMNSRLSKLKNARTDYTMNISSVGETQSYAVAKGMLSTVCVSASNTNTCSDSTMFFSKSMLSRGSGVILEIDKNNGDAYIITNYHVVSNANTAVVFSYVWVMLWDSISPISAQYVGGSRTYDIAVLKIEGSNEVKNSSATGASIAKSSDLCIGESVCAIGNSMARNLRITSGVVSVEEDLMGSATFYNMYISHSADVNSGNSGGGLYNNKGELIGIVNAKFRDVNPTSGDLMYKEVVHGMNYAIPVDLAVGIARNIIRNNGTLLRPAIGLTLGDGYSYNDKNYEITEKGFGYTTYSLVIDNPTGKFWLNDKFISASYEFNGQSIDVKLNRLFSIESALFNLDRYAEIIFVVDRSGIENELKVKVNSVTSVS